MEENKDLILEAQDGIEEQTEIVEDLPVFDDDTADSPAESAESVDNQSADTESAILTGQNDGETDTTEADSETDTKGKKEDKPNLPTGFSFNPLVIAIKPFYDQAIAEDELFAKEVKEKESRAVNPKSLAECAEYIMGEAYKYASEHRNGNFGLAGFPDEQMPSLIKHYYDEDDIKIKRFSDARASVSTTNNAPTYTPPVKGKKKGAEKPKPVKNVLDITKAIVSATKTTEDGKKDKREKKKDSLKAGFVPMERPATLKDARKGSREQAQSVNTIDMFADFFANEDKE